MDMVFRSKVNIWLVGVTVAIPVLVLSFIFVGARRNEWTADLIATVIVVIVLAFILWIYLTTRYTITADTLRIKSGPFFWVIPLDEIATIEPTRNPVSSPALSLDRLLIRYGGSREIMMSPADKAGFMAAITKRPRPLPKN